MYFEIKSYFPKIYENGFQMKVTKYIILLIMMQNEYLKKEEKCSPYPTL